MTAPHSLMDKLNTLPSARLQEVEDFVDFLRSRERDRALLGDGQTASIPAFAAIWNNPDDDVYDAL